MTTQSEPTPQAADAATDALAPPGSGSLRVRVAFARLFVIGWLTSGGNTPRYTCRRTFNRTRTGPSGRVEFKLHFAHVDRRARARRL